MKHALYCISLVMMLISANAFGGPNCSECLISRKRVVGCVDLCQEEVCNIVPECCSAEWTHYCITKATAIFENSEGAINCDDLILGSTKKAYDMNWYTFSSNNDYTKIVFDTNGSNDTWLIFYDIETGIEIDNADGKKLTTLPVANDKRYILIVGGLDDAYGNYSVSMKCTKPKLAKSEMREISCGERINGSITGSHITNYYHFNLTGSTGYDEIIFDASQSGINSWLVFYPIYSGTQEEGFELELEYVNKQLIVGSVTPHHYLFGIRTHGEYIVDVKCVESKPPICQDCLTYKQGTKGCSKDLECEAKVCNISADCCQVSWEKFCIAEATYLFAKPQKNKKTISCGDRIYDFTTQETDFNYYYLHVNNSVNEILFDSNGSKYDPYLFFGNSTGYKQLSIPLNYGHGHYIFAVGSTGKEWGEYNINVKCNVPIVKHASSDSNGLFMFAIVFGMSTIVLGVVAFWYCCKRKQDKLRWQHEHVEVELGEDVNQLIETEVEQFDEQHILKRASTHTI